MKVALVLVLLLLGAVHVACGECGQRATPDADATPPQLENGGAEGAIRVDGDDGAAAVADPEAADLAAWRRQMLEALSALEVPGFDRARSQIRGETVTLWFSGTRPNERGQVGTVEVTVGFCDPCPEVSRAALEEGRDALLAQYGELHANNPGLVVEIDDFELLPQRPGVSTFLKSYVDDGVARAALVLFEATYLGNGAALRLKAYPQSGFPADAAEHDASLTKTELGDLARAVAQGVARVLWPPLKEGP